MAGELISRVYTGIWWGLIVVSIICLAWWYWAMAYYKYSIERLAGLALFKYNLDTANTNKLTTNTMFVASNIVIKSDLSGFDVDIEIRDSINKTVLSSEHKFYLFKDNCSLVEPNCVRL
jgi:hypothetical protein